MKKIRIVLAVFNWIIVPNLSTWTLLRFFSGYNKSTWDWVAFIMATFMLPMSLVLIFGDIRDMYAWLKERQRQKIDRSRRAKPKESRAQRETGNPYQSPESDD